MPTDSGIIYAAFIDGRGVSSYTPFSSVPLMTLEHLSIVKSPRVILPAWALFLALFTSSGGSTGERSIAALDSFATHADSSIQRATERDHENDAPHEALRVGQFTSKHTQNRNGRHFVLDTVETAIDRAYPSGGAIGNAVSALACLDSSWPKSARGPPAGGS